MEELWKDIPGYEGIYQVSNMGRVRSLDRRRLVNNCYGRQSYRSDKGREIAQTDNGHGYLIVSLRKDHRKNHYVHRLVAEAFCKRPGDSVKVVNHKDYNTKNNRADNLECVTQAENINYSRDRMCRPHKSRPTNTGEKYIYRIKNVGEDSFRVHVRRKGLTAAERIFPTLQEAVAYRDEVMRLWRDNVSCAIATE